VGLEHGTSNAIGRIGSISGWAGRTVCMVLESRVVAGACIEVMLARRYRYATASAFVAYHRGGKPVDSAVRCPNSGSQARDAGGTGAGRQVPGR
jgi:hypothetical protein